MGSKRTTRCFGPRETHVTRTRGRVLVLVVVTARQAFVATHGGIFSGRTRFLPRVGAIETIMSQWAQTAGRTRQTISSAARRIGSR